MREQQKVYTVDELMSMIREKLNSERKASADKKETEYAGTDLAAWIQSALNARGARIRVDGDFGDESLHATADFISKH